MGFILHNKLNYSIVIKNATQNIQNVGIGNKIQIDSVYTEIINNNNILLKIYPINIVLSTLILTESNNIFIFNKSHHQQKIICIHDNIKSIIENQYSLNIPGTKHLLLVDDDDDDVIDIKVQPEYLNGYEFHYEIII